MDSIVLQLQRDATDVGIRVSDLLRKGLIVAQKLGMQEFEAWISNELDGYGEDSDLPDYRVVTTQLRAFNPYRGWERVNFEDPTEWDAVSRMRVGQPIAQIEALLEGEEKPSGLTMAISEQLRQSLMNRMNYPARVEIQVPYSQVQGIVDAVRTITLKWALQMERDGLLGEGLAFTEDEAARASEASYHITTFYGPVGHSQIQQSSDQSTQVMVGAQLDPDLIKDFVNRLSSIVDDLGLDATGEAELLAEIQTLESQLGSPNPKQSILKEALRSVRRILEGAAGEAARQLIRFLLESQLNVPGGPV